MIWQYINQGVDSIISFIVPTILGGFVFMFRKIFTNEKQINMLRKELESREELRKQDREMLKETREDVRELRNKLFEQN